MSERFSMSGHIALVTGASRGIGAAIADDLAQAGATVIGTATTGAGATTINNRMSDAGVSGRGATLDVTNRAAGAALVKNIAAKEGVVTLLVKDFAADFQPLASSLRIPGHCVALCNEFL